MTGIKNRFSRKCGVYVETALQYSVSLFREAEAGEVCKAKARRIPKSILKQESSAT